VNVHPKVSALVLAGAIVTVIVWGARVLGLEVPGDVASALTTIIAFAAAYVTPTGDWEPKA